jgi:hypothetical protein
VPGPGVCRKPGRRRPHQAEQNASGLSTGQPEPPRAYQKAVAVLNEGPRKVCRLVAATEAGRAMEENKAASEAAVKWMAEHTPEQKMAHAREHMAAHARRRLYARQKRDTTGSALA